MTERCPTLRLVGLTVKRCTQDSGHFGFCAWDGAKALNPFDADDPPVSIWFDTYDLGMDQTEPIKPVLVSRVTTRRISILERGDLIHASWLVKTGSLLTGNYHPTLEIAIETLRRRHDIRVEEYEGQLRRAAQERQSFYAKFIDPRNTGETHDPGS